MIISTSAEHTEKIAKNLAQQLKTGDVVRLHGDLGVGKTVFARGLVRGLESEDLVSSPTYSIMNVYHGKVDVYHFDLYRLEDENEVYEAGLYENIGKNGVSIIEWPDLVSQYPEGRVIDVYLSKNLGVSEDCREIVVKGADGFENTQH